MTKRIKIVSNGTPNGTRIYDGDGRDISGYFNSVTWRHEVGGVASVILTAPVVEVEIEGEVEEVNDPKLVDITSLGGEWRRHAKAKSTRKRDDNNAKENTNG